MNVPVAANVLGVVGAVSDITLPIQNIIES